MLAQLAGRAYRTLGDRTLEEIFPGALERAGPNGALTEALTRWAEAAPKPLVLLIDEIDSLVGDTLLTVLRQLRAGYDERPAGFPHCVILCGVRDVRDYRVHSGSANRMVLGGSAFNIRSESLRLGDFSEEEMRALLGQHTAETGQVFTPEGPGDDLDAHGGPAVAGERAVLRRLLPAQGRPRPLPPDHGARRRGIPGTADPGPRDAPRRPGEEAERRPRAARDRADPGRRGRATPGPTRTWPTCATWAW